MTPIVDPLLVVVLLLNLLMLGTSRLRGLVSISAAQGALLGALVIPMHREPTLQVILLAVATAGVKGLLIPSLLHKAMRDVHIRREVEPLIGYLPSLVLGALGTGSALLFGRSLPLLPLPALEPPLIVPASLATVFTGFLILTTRRKAITQVVGYLVLENGIFIMGLALLEAMPLLVELGVLLDLFVGIFVMGIVINHISREFTADPGQLADLKE